MRAWFSIPTEFWMDHFMNTDSIKVVLVHLVFWPSCVFKALPKAQFSLAVQMWSSILVTMWVWLCKLVSYTPLLSGMEATVMVDEYIPEKSFGDIDRTAFNIRVCGKLELHQQIRTPSQDSARKRPRLRESIITVVSFTDLRVWSYIRSVVVEDCIRNGFTFLRPQAWLLVSNSCHHIDTAGYTVSSFIGNPYKDVYANVLNSSLNTQTSKWPLTDTQISPSYSTRRKTGFSKRKW